MMRYVVLAKLKEDKKQQLKAAIDNGIPGSGSVAGVEYIRDMKHARLLDDGTVIWVEVCFCTLPLDEENLTGKNIF